MKNFKFLSLSIVVFLTAVSFSITLAQKLDGAWSLKGSDNHLLLVQDSYFSWTEMNDQNAFVNTLGGKLKVDGSQLVLDIQFNSGDKYLVGESYTTPFSLKDDVLSTKHPQGYDLIWDRIAEKDQGLAGVWRITGRKVDDKISKMERSPRKTYKLLTPGHFQWIAMNTDTGEFFGTGGGSYTFKNGKYTEKIEFFSRDNSRVGASLTFDGEIKNGDWHHSGKSSKGDPIYEIWSKETEY